MRAMKGTLRKPSVSRPPRPNPAKVANRIRLTKKPALPSTVQPPLPAPVLQSDRRLEAAEVVRKVVVEPRSSELTSPMSLYLREIGQVKLLTVQQENRLAARIKRGDASAREEMIKANLRLVVHIAHEYEHCGLPLLDLINEGNIGLMRAVERFDPAKGAKFSTYASLWIKQAMRRALADQAKTIRLPVNAADTLYRMRRAAVKLHDVLGREPSDEELAHELGISAKRVTELNVASIRPASLDASIGDEDSSLLGEVIEDQNATRPGEELEDRADLEIVRELFKTLDPRAATILRFRFGLDGKSEKTLEEIGAKFGLTRERIRQLQNEALNKLRKRFEELDTIEVAA
jgi:RNA polymerase primary sigma factor